MKNINAHQICTEIVTEKYNAWNVATETTTSSEREQTIRLATDILMQMNSLSWGGGLVQSVIDNDLEKFVGVCEKSMLRYLPFFVQIKNNAKHLWYNSTNK